MRPTRAAWIACAAAAVLLALAATACSGSKGSSAHDAGATEDAPATDGAIEATDAAADDALATVEAGPTGFVFFTTNEDGTGALGAVFDGTPIPAASCQVTTVYGACAVYTCPSAVDAGPTTGAGALTFAAPSLDGGVTIDAGASGLYVLSTPGALFSAGDPLTVTASGGVVPAFGPATVTAPGAITLTNPVPDGGAIAVPTSSDFGFAWTGGSIDSAAVLTASGVASDGSLVVVRCSYVGITDEGILPSPVLAAVHGLSQGILGWGQANSTTVDAGPWSVTLLAGAYGSTPATFQ